MISQADCGMISGIFPTARTTDFLSRKPHSLSWGFLETFIRNTRDAVFTNEVVIMDAPASRSVRPVVDILIKEVKRAPCCRFVVEKNPEMGGKVRKTRPASR